MYIHRMTFTFGRLVDKGIKIIAAMTRHVYITAAPPAAAHPLQGLGFTHSLAASAAAVASINDDDDDDTLDLLHLSTPLLLLP